MRKYNDCYIKYGFTVLGYRPQCVVCSELLSAESMKPSKMIRHLETKHSSLKDKPVDFFERKLTVLVGQKNSVSQLSSNNVSKNALLASYQVALRIAKKGKPHTIAEDLILPAAQDMLSTMVGPEAASKLSNVPLSNNSVGRRITEMAEDCKNQLKEKLQKSEFLSIQVDESTDVSNLTEFMCFVRYENDDGVEEDILFCKPLPDHATGEEMYKLFISATASLNIDWKKCVSICSDGAKALTGKKSGFVKLLMAIMPKAVWVHCFLHRQALASKNMPIELKEVLNDVVKSVNFIKSRPLQCRLFSQLCEEMGAEYKCLLLHTEVRWLSRGKVFSRVFALRTELKAFFQVINKDFVGLFDKKEWLLKLAYLADIFQHLNDLNITLQGRDKTIIFAQDRVNAFVKKLAVWASRVEKKNLENFELAHEFLTSLDERDEDFPDVSELSKLIVTHLTGLREQIIDYIPEDEHTDLRWVLNPFNEHSVNQADLSPHIHDKLIELSCDKTLQLSFSTKDVDKFWLDRRTEYPSLTTAALRIIMPFATSYLCELGFSTLINRRLRAEDFHFKSSSSEFAKILASIESSSSFFF
ncbi:zinc finger BED domain-containing protein 5-like isoform X1 [Bacillus rossius redtenbacheri]|uniref:zinc finger BED domain-containing protein 5-like isoform X1 n=1 Tax=Bacillus rossius redtenbacheri TaxID=93214 RepID=UPI002FDD52BA